MTTRAKKEVKPVVMTSFPDLLGEEEHRRNHNYPTEVRIERLQIEDLEADGLLDELLNDDDSLTDSEDDRVDLDAVMEDSEMEKKSNSFLGNLITKAKTSPSQEDVSMRSVSAAVDFKQVIFVEDSKARRTPSDATSRTSSEPSMDRLEEDEEASNDDDEEISVTSSNSSATQDLLERAHDRLNMQHLYEEIADLRKSMEQKDKEVEQMTGQLRRAVSTKCDLVLAHTELERHHEFNLRKLEEASKYLLKANFGLVEEQASNDVELMNEIVCLNREMQASKKLHSQELDDWERLHTNEMREKDFELAKLREEIRKLTVGTTQGRKQKQLRGQARQ